MKRITATLVALVLVGPAAASTPNTRFDVGPDVTNNSRIRADLIRAGRHWKAAPKCPVTVGVMDDDGDTYARAQLGGCRIWIDKGWWDSLMAQPRLLCNVIVHEYGHLLGHMHNHPRKIMRPVDADGARWVRECRKAR